jgi:hypothetical protein
MATAFVHGSDLIARDVVIGVRGARMHQMRVASRHA